MKVLLFYPDNMVKGTILPPYPLLYLAKALIKNGHEPRIIDARFESKRTIEDEISSTDFFAVSAGMNLQFATALPYAKIAKEHEIPTLFGGVFSTLNYEKLLDYPVVDGILMGEGEIAIVEAVEKGIQEALNTAYFNKKIHINPRANLVNLNDYSPLPWELIDLSRYVTKYKDKNIFYYTTSRSCPHRCDYCYQSSFWGRKWRGLNYENVKKEIDKITDLVKIDGIYLFDDNFLVNRKRAEKITSYIHQKGLEWSCMTRANYLDEDLVDHLKESGCFKLNIGAESGSQKTLDLMKKDIKVEDTLNAAKLIGGAGLNSEFYFMIGYKGESLEDVMTTVKTVDKVEKLCDAETFIRVALPFKGTHYFESATEAGFKRGDDLRAMCLEDWGRRPPKLPWFNKEENKVIKNIATLSEIRFMKKKFLENMPLLERLYVKTVYPLVELRWKKRVWKNLLELTPYNVYEGIRETRRLKDPLKIAGGMVDV